MFRLFKKKKPTDDASKEPIKEQESEQQSVQNEEQSTDTLIDSSIDAELNAEAAFVDATEPKQDQLDTENLEQAVVEKVPEQQQVSEEIVEIK